MSTPSILLAVAGLVAAWWLAGGVASMYRRRRGARALEIEARDWSPVDGHAWRRLTAVIACVGALGALAIAAVIWAMPGLVDVGFLGWMAFPLAIRVALHLPLAMTLLAASLAALLVAGAFRHWWIPRIKTRDLALSVVLIALAAQLASRHLVAWGL